jgi:heme-degrading monooxygenase HmoA
MMRWRRPHEPRPGFVCSLSLKLSYFQTEFLLLSLWESHEAIRAFAGEDLERAVYYAKDEEFLLELEPKVTHYEYESHHE